MAICSGDDTARSPNVPLAPGEPLVGGHAGLDAGHALLDVVERADFPAPAAREFSLARCGSTTRSCARTSAAGRCGPDGGIARLLASAADHGRTRRQPAPAEFVYRRGFERADDVDPLDGQPGIDSVRDERHTHRLPCRAPRGALWSRRRLLAPLLPGTAFIGEARIGGQLSASPPFREGRPDTLRPERQAPRRPSQPHLTGPEAERKSLFF
jgi:hypothetical protein